MAARKLPALWLCPACYERTAMHRFEGHGIDDMTEETLAAFAEAYDSLDRTCCCYECLSEAEYYAAKNAGQPLPFVGYERTLDWRSLPVVEQLEQLLRANYTFRPSRYPHSGGRDVLVVLPGSFTEPLTIAVYYVTARDEQEYLLSLIDRFFLASKFPQRKVQFFEAECWHHEVSGTSSSFHTLPAVLLREVVIR